MSRLIALLSYVLQSSKFCLNIYGLNLFFSPGALFSAPRSAFHKPWHRAPYLAERQAQLRPIINELDPHVPESSGLAIVGAAARTSSQQQATAQWDGRRPWSGSSVKMNQGDVTPPSPIEEEQNQEM